MKLYQNEALRRKIIEDNLKAMSNNTISEEELKRKTEELLKDTKRLELHKRALALKERERKQIKLFTSMRKAYEEKFKTSVDLHGLDRLFGLLMKLENTKEAREYNSKLFLAVLDKNASKELISDIVIQCFKIDPNVSLLKTEEDILNEYERNPFLYQASHEFKFMTGADSLTTEAKAFYEKNKELIGIGSTMSSTIESMAGDFYITSKDNDFNSIFANSKALATIYAKYVEPAPGESVTELKQRYTKDILAGGQFYMSNKGLEKVDPNFRFPKDAFTGYQAKADGKVVTMDQALQLIKDNKQVDFEPLPVKERKAIEEIISKPVYLPNLVKKELSLIYANLQREFENLKNAKHFYSITHEQYNNLVQGLTALFNKHANPNALDVLGFITDARNIKTLSDAYIAYRENTERNDIAERRYQVCKSISEITELKNIEKKMIAEPRHIMEEIEESIKQDPNEIHITISDENRIDAQLLEESEPSLDDSFIYDGDVEDFIEEYEINIPEPPKMPLPEAPKLVVVEEINTDTHPEEQENRDINTNENQSDDSEELEDENKNEFLEKFKEKMNFSLEVRKQYWENKATNEKSGPLTLGEFHDLELNDIAKAHQGEIELRGIQLDIVRQIFMKHEPVSYLIKVLDDSIVPVMERACKEKVELSSKADLKEKYNSLSDRSPKERITSVIAFAKEKGYTEFIDSIIVHPSLELFKKYPIQNDENQLDAFVKASKDAGVDIDTLEWKDSYTIDPFLEPDVNPEEETIKVLLENNPEAEGTLKKASLILAKATPETTSRLTFISEEFAHITKFSETQLTKKYILENYPDLANKLTMENSQITLVDVTQENLKAVKAAQTAADPIAFPEEFKEKVLSACNYMAENASDFELDKYSSEKASKYYAFGKIASARKSVLDAVTEGDMEKITNAVNSYLELTRKYDAMLEGIKYDFSKNRITPNISGARIPEFQKLYRDKIVEGTHLNELWMIIGFAKTNGITVEALLENPIEIVRTIEEDVLRKIPENTTLSRNQGFAATWNQLQEAKSYPGFAQFGAVSRVLPALIRLVPDEELQEKLSVGMMLERTANYEVINSRYLEARRYMKDNPVECMKNLLTVEQADRDFRRIIPAYVDPITGDASNFDAVSYMNEHKNYENVALRASQALEELKANPQNAAYKQSIKAAITGLFTAVRNINGQSQQIMECYERLASGKPLTNTMKQNLQSNITFRQKLESDDIKGAVDEYYELKAKYDSRRSGAKLFYSSVSKQHNLIEEYKQVLLAKLNNEAEIARIHNQEAPVRPVNNQENLENENPIDNNQNKIPANIPNELFIEGDQEMERINEEIQPQNALNEPINEGEENQSQNDQDNEEEEEVIAPLI